MQEPLLNNGFSNKYVSIDTTEQQQKNRVFFAIRAEML
jgi:hypothetical protein